MPRTKRTFARWIASAVFLAAFALIGFLVAHVLAYELLHPVVHLLTPEAHGGVHVPHGWLGQLGVVGSGMLLVGIAAVLLVAVRESRSLGGLLAGDGSWSASRQRVVAALVPAVGFIAVEYLERIGHGASMPLLLLAGGIAMQLLVGLLVLELARLVAAGVVRLARAIRAAFPPATAARRRTPVIRATSGDLPRLPALASNLAGRGPPARVR